MQVYNQTEDDMPAKTLEYSGRLKMVFYTVSKYGKWKALAIPQEIEGNNSLDVLSEYMGFPIYSLMFPDGSVRDRANGLRPHNYLDVYKALFAEHEL